MQHSFLVQVFQGLSPEEESRFRKFLISPIHNLRQDVVVLFDWLVAERRSETPVFDKAAAYRAVFPDKKWDANAMNLVARYLLEQMEHFIAYDEWQSDQVRCRLDLLKGLRKREISQHFERHSRKLGQTQLARTERHAGYYLTEYQLQQEILEQEIRNGRNRPGNLLAVTTALGHFFVLENLRWTGMAAALRLRSGAILNDPMLANSVHEWAAMPAQSLPVRLQYYSTAILKDPDNDFIFQQLSDILPLSTGLFPPAQCRDLYMSAINFCIRRQNKGHRDYTLKALALYRAAFEKGILLENGVLPQNTYSNINALAHLAGEGIWAEHFLETAKHLLAPSTRENSYRYNLAICFFRQGDYNRTLELLRDVDTSEIFVQIDVRRMLLRAYFELREWMALDSLLLSFKSFLWRKKDLGYHRENYLNLIRFTQKLVKNYYADRKTRNTLAEKITKTQQVAEREWLLEKLK